MTQLPAEFGPIFPDRDLIASAIGLTTADLDPGRPVQTVSTGLPTTIVPVRDLDTLRRATRNEHLVGEAVRASGGQDLYLFAPTAEGVTARMFDSEFGIGEDPATGSAAGPLGAYLAEYGDLDTTRSREHPSGRAGRSSQRTSRGGSARGRRLARPGGWRGAHRRSGERSSSEAAARSRASTETEAPS